MAKDEFKEIKDTLKEVGERLKNVAVEQEAFIKEMALLKESQAKTDEQIRKTGEEINSLREAQKKTDEQIRKTGEEINSLKEKTDELQKLQKKTEKTVDKVAKDIGGGLGRAAEGLTAPCVPDIFGNLGFKVKEVQQRVKSLDLTTRKVIAEVDLLCPARQNGKEVVLVGEVKAHLTSEDVQDFVGDTISLFKKNYSTYKEIDIIGFVSGLNIDESAKKFALRKGLYILSPKGETMEILNTSDFEPKLW